ncbi:MAG: hypothetical protein GY861_18140 [bacterium]|nr:hypothetical protein [bacterium]
MEIKIDKSICLGRSKCCKCVVESVRDGIDFGKDDFPYVRRNGSKFLEDIDKVCPVGAITIIRPKVADPKLNEL